MSAAEDRYEELVVRGEKKQAELTRFGTGQSTINLTGDELRLQLSNTLGETLSRQSGVHNASFGPSVGLPVLRGLSGVRVRIIEDGIGSWDASAMSPDHAVAIEPVLAESIYVLKGPASIEFGNAAVGGVVAVDTQRIPLIKTGETFTGSVELRRELINQHHQNTVAGKINTETDSFGLHVDGFRRSHDDVGISGCAIDVDKVNQQFGFDASGANTCGYIANSDAEADGYSIGAAFTPGQWYLGGSLREINNDYGIPPGSHTEPRDGGHNHGGEGADPYVRIDMEQRRFDFNAGVYFDHSFLTQLQLLIGKSDYEHLEAENGMPGTQFINDVTEAKVSLQHRFNENAEGVFGIQVIDRYFSATGAENFVPPSDIDAAGFYVQERWQFSQWVLQAGGRLDVVELTQLEATAPLRPDNRQLLFAPIEYQTGSYHLAAEWLFNDYHTFSLSWGIHQRAPEVQELFSLGPHLATRSYDMGMLIRSHGEIPDAETFNTVEFTWQWQSSWGTNSWQLFYSEVDDFIYQANAGVFFDLAEQLFRNNCVRLAECLPVYEYTQDEATLRGGEWQWHLPAWQILHGSLTLELFADVVIGDLSLADDNRDTAIPRMPPWRTGSSLNWSNPEWLFEVTGTYVAAQNDPGEYETATESYYRFDASLHWLIPATDNKLSVFLKGRNLTDQSIRNATSFIRNFSPEPGRSLELGLRWDW